MKLKRFLLRYYPPGIILEYETKGDMKSKDIDLLDLSVECVAAPQRLPFCALHLFLSVSARALHVFVAATRPIFTRLEVSCRVLSLRGP